MRVVAVLPQRKSPSCCLAAIVSYVGARSPGRKINLDFLMFQRSMRSRASIGHDSCQATRGTFPLWGTSADIDRRKTLVTREPCCTWALRTGGARGRTSGCLSPSTKNELGVHRAYAIRHVYLRRHGLMHYRLASRGYKQWCTALPQLAYSCSRKSSVGSASYESRANAPFGPARYQRPASLGSARGEGPGARPCPWWVRRAGGGLLYRISIRTQMFLTSDYMNRCQQPLSLCVSSAPSRHPADDGGSTSRAPC